MKLFLGILLLFIVLVFTTSLSSATLTLTSILGICLIASHVADSE